MVTYSWQFANQSNKASALFDVDYGKQFTEVFFYHSLACTSTSPSNEEMT